MNRINFLLVDDSPSTNFFNKVMLEKVDELNELKIAENGQVALEILNSQYIPEIILLDINMPVMNGWQFLEEFQKLDKKFQDTMIILMLGAELPESKKQLIKTIPNIKGCVEKMLTKDVIKDILTKFQNNLLVNECESILR